MIEAGRMWKNSGPFGALLALGFLDWQWRDLPLTRFKLRKARRLVQRSSLGEHRVEPNGKGSNAGGTNPDHSAFNLIIQAQE